MTDLDQGGRPLFEGLAPQFGNPVLGDDIIDKGALGGDHAARLQHRHDARNTAAVDNRRRGRDDHRLAGVAEGGGNGEGRLSARSGIHERPERLGAGLTAEIDCQRVVDGDIVLLVDQQAQVVGIGEIVELEIGVAVDNRQLVVKHPDARAGHHLAGIDGFILAGDDPFLDQPGNAAGDDLGMNPQVILVAQIHGNRRGHAAQADLQGIAVVDQVAGHQGADQLGCGDFLVVALGRRQLGRRLGGFDKIVDLRHMDIVLSAGADEVLVHLGNDRPGGLGHGFGHEQPVPEATVTVLVGSRDRGHVHVAGEARRQFSAPKIHHRDEIQPAVVHQRAGGRAEIGGLNRKRLLDAGLVPVEQRPDGADPDLSQLLFALQQRLAEGQRRGVQPVELHAVAAAHRSLDGLLGRNKFIATVFTPVHTSPPCTQVRKMPGWSKHRGPLADRRRSATVLAGA